MVNMKLLTVVSTPSVYRGCSTWKTIWKKKFTVDEFSSVNVKNCGPHNVRKQREIKGSDKYVTLDILLQFSSMENMIITCSETIYNLIRSGKELITSLGIKPKPSPKKNKKARYTIKYVIKKDPSKIIMEFEHLPSKSYESRRPKHEPTDSYFYLSRELAKCMMRADALNSFVYPAQMEMTATNQTFVLQTRAN